MDSTSKSSATEMNEEQNSLAAESLAEVVQEWTREWFSADFDHLRFAAQKPSTRPIFRAMCKRHSASFWRVQSVVAKHLNRTYQSRRKKGFSWRTSRKPRWEWVFDQMDEEATPERDVLLLRTAVYLDQMIRNMEGFWDEDCKDCMINFFNTRQKSQDYSKAKRAVDAVTLGLVLLVLFPKQPGNDDAARRIQDELQLLAGSCDSSGGTATAGTTGRVVTSCGGAHADVLQGRRRPASTGGSVVCRTSEVAIIPDGGREPGEASRADHSSLTSLGSTSAQAEAPHTNWALQMLARTTRMRRQAHPTSSEPEPEEDSHPSSFTEEVGFWSLVLRHQVSAKAREIAVRFLERFMEHLCPRSAWRDRGAPRVGRAQEVENDYAGLGRWLTRAESALEEIGLESYVRTALLEDDVTLVVDDAGKGEVSTVAELLRESVRQQRKCGVGERLLNKSPLRSSWSPPPASSCKSTIGTSVAPACTTRRNTITNYTDINNCTGRRVSVSEFQYLDPVCSETDATRQWLAAAAAPTVADEDTRTAPRREAADVEPRQHPFLPHFPPVEVLEAGTNSAGRGEKVSKEALFAGLLCELREALRSQRSPPASANDSTPSNVFNDDPSVGVVLSLSGGVDSIVHACLLSVLRREGEFAGTKFCALHLRHGNRDVEPLYEQRWVERVCLRLQLPLYTYHVPLTRPHGSAGQDAGLTRERYEECTKAIRFRMYERCFQKMNTTNNFVILGHHEDDLDENRIAEMLKGNVVNLDGTERWTTQQIQPTLRCCCPPDMGPSVAGWQTTICRPLLNTRKSAFVQFAAWFNVPYMRDSTPLWSRRGCTRQVLDWIATTKEADTPGVRRMIGEKLHEVGTLSTALGGCIDACVANWKQRHIREINSDSNNVADDDDLHVLDDADRCSVPREPPPRSPTYVLELAPLFELASSSLASEFAAVVAKIEEFRAVWNPLLREHVDCVNGKVASALDPIPATTTTHQHSFDAGPFLFTRAMYAAQGSSPGRSAKITLQTKTSGKILLGKKSLHHSWQACAKARITHVQNGNLHREVGYRYLPKQKLLLVRAGSPAELAEWFSLGVRVEVVEDGAAGGARAPAAAAAAAARSSCRGGPGTSSTCDRDVESASAREVNIVLEAPAGTTSPPKHHCSEGTTRSPAAAAGGG